MNDTLDKVFRAALERVDPYLMLERCLLLQGSTLRVVTEQRDETFDLTRFDRIEVIGTGKAAAVMAHAVEDILGERLSGGVISTKYGFGQSLRRIQIIEAGHPVPDDNSALAARRIAEAARRADERTLVLCLISGGGSALMAAPYEDEHTRLALADKQSVTKTLLACGADITEINCMRKHLSLVKGGRLAQLLYPATTVCLILSDVVGDSLDTIASGPTAPDASTFAQADAIIRRYGIREQLPSTARLLLERGLAGDAPDTPAPDNPAFQRVHNFLIGTNYQSLLAAAKCARELGLEPLVLTDCLEGEAKEAARALFALARFRSRYGVERPMLLILGGETTVTLSPDAGKGGRNQEMALAFLNELKRAGRGMQNVTLLAASTDGNDGPTDAAGAWASLEVLRKAGESGLKPSEYLRAHDAYHFFETIGELYKTGPTRTNVGDIQLLLIEK